MSLLAFALLLAAADDDLAVEPPADPFELCVQQDPVLAADSVVPACEDASRSGAVTDQVRALSQLALAYVALGKDEAASDTYLRMLALSGRARPAAGAPMRALRAYEIARNRLMTEAPVIVRATARAAEPGVFDLDIADPMLRLVTLVARGPDDDEQLVELTRAGEGRWRAQVSLAEWLEGRPRVTAALEGIGWDGVALSEEPLATLTWPRASRASGALRPIGGGLLVGAGVAGLLLGVGTSTMWASASAQAQEAEAAGRPLPACLGWCVGARPYVLGVSGEDRKALTDGSASGWITAGAIVAVTGAVLTAAGVVVLVTGDE